MNIRWALPSLVLLVGALAAPASAQDIQHAQRVLARNPEAARAEATQLLESGASGAEQLVQIHRVLGEASARLDDEQQAVRSFTALLALDPNFRVERNAPDQVRSPYMEAAGFWTDQPVRLGVDVRAAEDRDVLLVQAVDPGNVAARVRIRARLAGGTYVELVRPTSAPFEVALNGMRENRRVEYSIALIDEFGNRLHQRGSDATPETITIEAPVVPVVVTPPPTQVPVTPPDPLPFYIAAGVVGVVGLGAVGGAAALHAERESLAARWNAGNCTGPGVTRGEVCASERSAISTNEVLAGILYGVGGAAIAAAVVIAIVAPTPTGESASPQGTAEPITVRCGLGPGDLGVACGARF
jgi:hypothetical protein